MDKGSRDVIDGLHRNMIERWRRELQDPNISQYSKDTLTYLIERMEENFQYTYTAVKLPYHTQVVKHKRTEPRPLVWEEERRFFLIRWWIKLTVWWDWYCNK